MKKVLIIILILCTVYMCIGCGTEKVEPSGIDWMGKMQERVVVSGYLETLADIDDEDIATYEMNAVLTLTIGLAENLFDFDRDEFNLLMDEYVYYPNEPKFATVCQKLGIKVKDWGLGD